MTKITEKLLFCHDCEHTTVYHHVESYSTFGGQPVPAPEDYGPPSVCAFCGSTKLEIADPVTEKPFENSQRSYRRETYNHKWFVCSDCKAITHHFDYFLETGSDVSGTKECEKCGSQNLDQFKPKGSTPN